MRVRSRARVNVKVGNRRRSSSSSSNRYKSLEQGRAGTGTPFRNKQLLSNEAWRGKSNRVAPAIRVCRGSRKGKIHGTESHPYSGLLPTILARSRKELGFRLVGQARARQVNVRARTFFSGQSGSLAKDASRPRAVAIGGQRRRQASPGSQASPGFNEIPVGLFSGLRSLGRSLRGGGQIGEATVGVGGS